MSTEDLVGSNIVEDDFGPDHPRSAAHCAKVLLDLISTGRPVMIKPHVGQILDSIPEVPSGPNETVIEGYLLAISELAKANADAIPNDKQVIDKLSRYALKGTRVQMKLAATILATSPRMETACSAVYKKLVTSLVGSSPDWLVSCLGALSRIAKHAPQVFELFSKPVIDFILKELMTKPSEGDQPNDDKWISDEELCDLSKARVEGLKVLTNRCITYASTDEARTVSAPVFKLLWQLLVVDGKIGKVKHSVAVACRLRLKAAQSLLKLACYPAFSDDVEANFQELAMICQDNVYEVRESFLRKLVKYLHQRKLNNPRFNVILFLVAIDFMPTMLEMARTSIISRLKFISQSTRTFMFETIIVQLLHALAHHPDFDIKLDELQTFSRYLKFYIDCVGNSENVSLLYHLAGQVKTVQDAESETHTNFLYALSELAQLVIKSKAQEHHWSLPTYPGIVKLPTNIFRPLPSPAMAQEISKEVYLPEEFLKIFSASKGSLSEHQRTTGSKRSTKKPTGHMGDKKRKLISEEQEAEEQVQQLEKSKRERSKRRPGLRQQKAQEVVVSDAEEAEAESEAQTEDQMDTTE